MKKQSDYPTLTPSIEHIKKGDIVVGDLITNVHSLSVWKADDYDVAAINGEKLKEHEKFRKMIPIN